MTVRSLPDARYLQIGALSVLLLLNFFLIDFGARPLPSLVAIGAALLTQIICVRLTGAPLDLRSPLITGLSLSLLLRADALWLYATAGVIAIASKFLLRAGGKHIFNPAGFAIVLLLSPRAVSGSHRANGAPKSGSWRWPGFWRSWCCQPRGAPTSRSSSFSAMLRCSSPAPPGLAIPSLFRSISCRAARC